MGIRSLTRARPSVLVATLYSLGCVATGRERMCRIRCNCVSGKEGTLAGSVRLVAGRLESASCICSAWNCVLRQLDTA